MSDLPPIPSHQSSQRSERSTSDSSSGQPMQSDPPSSSTGHENPTSSRSSDRPATISSRSGRRRKVPDSLTPNACTNCKKARAKCDGVKPSCQRCHHRKIPCHYDLHAKTAKEQMIREIQRLQRRNEDLEEQKDTLDEKNTWIEQIMHSLREDRQASEIVMRLKRGESHKIIAEWLGRPLIGDIDVAQLSPTTETDLNTAITQYHSKLVEDKDPRYWTSATHDAQLIRHLITLYLTWIHPVHMLFDEEHFVASFENCSDVYCAPGLVNIICAMSCHLLHDIDTEDEETTRAIDYLRNRFVAEAKSFIRTAEMKKLTTIQTYAIMFLTELGSGHGLMGTSHLRLAVETLVEKHHAEQSAESEQVAAWGILTLHTAWSAFIYTKPQVPISTHAATFAKDIFSDGREGFWRLYKQPGDTDNPQRPAFSVMTASEHAKLFRIAHETMLVYCGSRGRVSAHHLLNLYERFVNWREELPLEIRDIISDSLPHVLFLHIQYHTAIMQLFQPLLHLESISVESRVVVHDIVSNHTSQGLQLLIQYRDVYSNYYLSPLQLFCMVQICDSYIRHGRAGETSPRIIEFCFGCLEDAKVGYPVAGPLQKMFRTSLSEYNVPVPDELERMIGESVRLGPDELVDACTRTTYKQPISQVLPNMTNDIGQTFSIAWQQSSPQLRAAGERTRARSMSGKGKGMDIGSMLNP